ncbi:MutS-related protein [Flavobacterium sp. 3HN19-14]|uniref:MutS-related protein n=1 Tax=Flavobacterium sp. 3HN19-14 TaxID=3448133 RepID=UPI003EE0B0AD
MEVYKTRAAQFNTKLGKIKKQYNTISFLRLMSILLMLVSLFYLIKTGNTIFTIAAMLLFTAFIFLMRRHTTLSRKKAICEAVIKINTDETDYLERKAIPFENGVGFNSNSHPYAYDLDIFGANSLFHNLNRTTTYPGKQALANGLWELSPNETICQNQEAIKELSQKLEWRQDFMALGRTGKDSHSQFTALQKWAKSVMAPVSKQSLQLAYVTPVLFFGVMIAYIITGNIEYTKVLSFIFVLNMSFLGKFFKRIKAEIQYADGIDKTIRQYGLIIEKIENETFTSQKLFALQQQLRDQKASVQLKKLSELFSYMDAIGNLVTTMLFNGTFLFHIHILNALLKWKKQNAQLLESWLEVIGEFEMLNSLANFSYNNPDFAFPEINSNKEISFTNLSHPLLNKATRVGNDVNFQPQSFMILTGSNMSGKSTFLRSLGVNMVLSGMGAPVCAEKANVHPMPVMVSMRLSDSLTDSESYFYAEIKRLKQIMDGLENQTAFVLLDEILRGTNSDDKRSGTIAVVKKMIAKNAIGAIATHDIEVCLTTNEFPEKLTNKCFEVEIINDDLHFDYKLRDGICKNKSATFLMKKMEII